MQTDAASRGCVAEYHHSSAEAPHTEAYLWPRIISLCAELGARRVVDIGCGNGALCRELARRGYEVVGCEPSADGVQLARSSAPELVFHQLGVDDDPSVVGNESFRRSRYHQHAVSRLLEESSSCARQQVGRTSQSLLGRRTHQVLVAQDSLAAVERSWFPRRSLHWSGQNTFPVEEHDYNCTEARETELQDGGLGG
ncbi:MAG: hypothetical protein DMF28_10235 [Verrucomicrobia bacterium]|nr:MAG: hypothetical protein DMF28_10235 [Verrucomicrobiota bacterium]